MQMHLLIASNRISSMKAIYAGSAVRTTWRTQMVGLLDLTYALYVAMVVVNAGTVP